MKEFINEPLPLLLRLAFWGILLFSIYHLARDLLQTFGLNSAFTDIGHRSHQWCGAYCDVVTIPFDVIGIVISAIILKRGKIGKLGVVLITTLPLLIVFALLP